MLILTRSARKIISYTPKVETKLYFILTHIASSVILHESKIVIFFRSDDFQAAPDFVQKNNSNNNEHSKEPLIKQPVDEPQPSHKKNSHSKVLQKVSLELFFFALIKL